MKLNIQSPFKCMHPYKHHAGQIICNDTFFNLDLMMSINVGYRLYKLQLTLDI